MCEDDNSAPAAVLDPGAGELGGVEQQIHQADPGPLLIRGPRDEEDAGREPLGARSLRLDPQRELVQLGPDGRRHRPAAHDRDLAVEQFADGGADADRVAAVTEPLVRGPVELDDLLHGLRGRVRKAVDRVGVELERGGDRLDRLGREGVDTDRRAPPATLLGPVEREGQVERR